MSVDFIRGQQHAVVQMPGVIMRSVDRLFCGELICFNDMPNWDEYGVIANAFKGLTETPSVFLVDDLLSLPEGYDSQLKSLARGPVLKLPFDTMVFSAAFKNGGPNMDEGSLSALPWIDVTVILQVADGLLPNSPHALSAIAFASVDNSVPVLADFLEAFELDEFYRLTGDAAEVSLLRITPVRVSPEFEDSLTLKHNLMVRPVVNAALFALALLGCSNVKENASEPSRAVRKRIKRSGNNKGLIYKQLQLVLPGKKGKNATGTPNNQATVDTRLHMCRGHFATYTCDKPLFGKMVGTFWIPAHVRGNPNIGVVAKDYVVTSGGMDADAELGAT